MDSDNELTSPRFLQAVADALADPQIAGAEPIEFAVLDTMPALDRYFALLGMNDPLVLFLGTYDRLCQVTGKWTGVDHVVVEEVPHLPQGPVSPGENADGGGQWVLYAAVNRRRRRSRRIPI